MLRNIIRLSLFIFLISLPVFSEEIEQIKVDPRLVKPMKELFNHRSHVSSFKKSGVSCVDCHSFSVKAVGKDPLGEPVKSGFIAASPSRCHACHMNKINLPAPNQCVMCHRDVVKLQPEDHFHSWMNRHGRIAQMDSNRCVQCHSKSSCSECHTQKNLNKPAVHLANFRLFHSIEARANPQSCVACHSSAQNSCVRCHSTGGP